ncbi:MAG: hypothetical protein OXR66_08015 [Candidatus Woesearchaeota archaeon]|nr:hypothetical protein [Candidatus Woesearchaeota archaeon]
MVDVAGEVAKLREAGKSASEIQQELENRGFPTDAIASAVAHKGRSSEDKRNSRLLATREVFDRIGYGAATPQFVNILFWLSATTYPYILFLIGVLNGLKTLLSICLSNALQEYNKLHKFDKNTISAAGVIFGFSFLLLAFSLTIRSKWLFAAGFLIGSIGVVAYGDLYRKFVHDTIKKERMGGFLRSIANWGVLITAGMLLVSGWLLHMFPMQGTKIVLFGHKMQLFGYLVMFMITAITLILSGYMTSFLKDAREQRTYPFIRFMKEHHYIMKSHLHVFWSNKHVTLLTLASLVSGILQIVIASYSGIAIYKLLDAQLGAPFMWLAIIYAIAVIASITGPFFTQQIHKSTGLAPTLVFGTLLMAILPFVLVFNTSILAVALGLVFYVIGSAIQGFGQGLIAKKLLKDDIRTQYFRAQSMALAIPYIVFIPVLAWIGNTSLNTIFLVTAIGMVAIVMPIYFTLVVMSQHEHL